MKLTAEQIQSNWELFLNNIKEHIPGNRKKNTILRFQEGILNKLTE